MRIPSATGLVFASLALSGSSLAAPTPASPNPSSPNPGNINSPRPDLDSPRFPNSPSIGSPRTLGQASFLNRRNNRVRRPLGRKRSFGADPSAAGLAPDGSEGVAAAPMQRSLAHISARGDGTVQAEGLGLIDQPTADTVKKALHDAADALKNVQGAGPALAELLDGVGATIIGVLGPNAAPGERRALPHRMRRQASAEAGNSAADGTVNAEGLGLIPVATGKQLDDALHAIGGAVGEKVPIVGPVVGGLLGTVGDILTGLLARDHIPDAPIDAESLPASAYQQLPAGFAYSATSPYVGSTPGQVIGEFVGPDGRVYQEIAEPFSQVMQTPGHLAQHAQQAAGNVVGQASGLPGPVAGVAQTAGQTLGVLGGILPTGLLGGVLGSVQGVAGGPLSTAQGLVGGVLDTASGVVPGVANAGQIIGYLANGLPVFSTVQALSQPASGQAHPQDMVGQVGQTVSGVHQAVSGMVAGTPAGAVSNGASTPLLNSPAGSVIGAAQAASANIPVAGGMLGSLPIISKDGNAAGSTFGILSNPSDPSAASASPDESGQNADQPADGTSGDEPDSGEDDGEEDDDGKEDGSEGKDPTDGNDPTPSEGSSVAAPSATASTTQSVAQGTPTPILPSSTA